MALPLTMTSLSEIEAVNIMLGTISVAPVSSIDDSGSLNVSVAKQMLFDTSRGSTDISVLFQYRH